jgi:starvation-inducible DNA-binding protein
MNQRLADAVDIQMQMRQAHWNVRGPHFISLHELFEQIDEVVESYVDLIVERIVQLGGVSCSGWRCFACCFFAVNGMKRVPRITP